MGFPALVVVLIAVVVCALVEIVTDWGRPGLATQILVTAFCAVAEGTVLAEGVVRLVGAFAVLLARVDGARHSIIALLVGRATLLGATRESSVELVDAGVLRRVTVVVGAEVLVIAARGRPWLAVEGRIARLFSVAEAAVVTERVVG